MIVRADQRRVLLVLGMHRSGTSATARVVNLLGANLGDSLVKPSSDNPDGFWEHADAVRINDVLLEGLGRTWYDMREMPKSWLDTPAAGEALGQIEALIRRDFQPDALWAVKDPRMCLTAPLWIKALQRLDYEVDCLFVVRDPREVVNSLNVRNGWNRGPLFLMWVQYLMEAEAATRCVRRTLITYDELLLDWRSTMQRIAAELKLLWSVGLDQAAPEVDAFLNKGRRHHVAHPADAAIDIRDDMPELAGELYQACLSISRGEKPWDSISRLQKTYRIVADIYAEHVDQLVTQRWQVEARAQEAEAMAQQAEAEAREAEAMTQQAEAKAQEAEAMAQQAEAKAQEAEAMAQQAEAKAQEAEAMTQQAEAKAQEAEAMTQQTEARAREAEAMTQETEARAIELRARLDDLQHALAKKDALIEEIAAVAAGKDSMIQQLVTSTSWRITAPLRWVRKAFMPRAWKALLGRSVKSTYERLPLSTQRRLALKGMLFRRLAPLIRTTRSYRAWQAFEAHRGAAVLSPSSRVQGAWRSSTTESEASVSRATRVLSDLNAAATSSAASDYVALDDKLADLSRIDVRAIAFYLPQFHPIPENDEWWGRGFTEWTNVSKAVPQFVGHYQPRLPGELGFYDLRLVEVMRRQVELAKHYGLQGFCFHFYWFGGRRLLERPLEQFVADQSIDFPFCICWANENWSRRWDGMDQDILIGQDHSPEDDIAFITALEPLLRDPRYIRVDGRPLIVLYRPSILPDAKATQRRWREHCRKVDIGEICLAMVQFDVEDPRVFGFDVAIEFPPHKLARGLEPINERLQVVNPEYAGYVIDYDTVIERAREHEAVGYDMIRGVFPSWDNEARKPGRGYTFANATPVRYREWLNLAIDYARRHPVAGEKLVFINAWNEWAEGAYLEPDRRYGYAYLDQTRTALTERSTSASERIVVVSHDAHPHGAQYLALNMVRTLRQVFHHEVDLVLLGEGAMKAEFARWARVHDLAGLDPQGEEARAVAGRLHQAGARCAIANTTVSGFFARTLKSAGFTVVGLVHELPGVLRDNGLEPQAIAMADSVDRLVFPAEAVKQGFLAAVDTPASRITIRRQGLYKLNRHASPQGRLAARRQLRERLGLEQDARIVLCVGYADHRKGVDLFVDLARRLTGRDKLVHFVWVGHFDIRVEPVIRDRLESEGLRSRVHFMGHASNTDVFYAGADVYALTSREDPFPSVVMESLQVAVPVVGFAGAGGFTELLDDGCGVCVPMENVDAFAQAVEALLHDQERALALGERGRFLVEDQFSFRGYMFDLLAMLGVDIPRVSVVVPNYNYAHLLGARLASIADQSHPFFELIVLDDCSSDNSLDVIREFSNSHSVHVRCIVSDRNSGSVFRQWHKGVALARGEYVWIAEADDLAEPDFLSRVLEVMRDPRVVLGYAQSKQLDQSGRLIAGDYRDYTRDVSEDRWAHPYCVSGQEEIRQCLAIKNTIPNVSAVIFRREVLLQVLEEHLGEICSFRIAGDWVTYMAVLEKGSIAFVPDALNMHRRHSKSVTLGGDHLPHLREVLRVQSIARQRYQLGSQALGRANAYVDHLCSHFGIDRDMANRLQYELEDEVKT